MAVAQRDHLRRRSPVRGAPLWPTGSAPQQAAAPAQSGATRTRDDLSDRRPSRDVGATIMSVQQAIDALGTFRETARINQEKTSALRLEVEKEKIAGQQLRQRLGDLERSLSVEHKRATDAEEHADRVDTTIKNLQDDIDVLRHQTKQLIDAATLLLTAEADKGEMSRPIPQRPLHGLPPRSDWMRRP